MNDQELLAIADEFDTFFIEMCMKHNLSGLDFSAVCLARMTKISKEIGYDTSYQKMMVKINGITALGELNQHGHSVH